MAEKRARFLVEAEDATAGAMLSVERNLSKVNQAVSKVGAAFGVVFSAEMALQFGQQIVTAAREAEQASTRLDAVLRATGHSAGLAKGELDDMADSLAALTQFDDESIRGAQATLLKFGNIQDDVFKRALTLAADYAAFIGTEIPDAAQVIGKALASPTEGLGQLERQIGKISPATQAMIKDMMESGRVTEAQGVVLDLLTRKLGGTAEAMNTGFTKATRDAKKAYDEFLEALGKTSVVKGAVQGTLGQMSTELTRMKSIIEDGTWYEKMLALLYAQSPAARVFLDAPTLSKKGGGPDAAGAALAKAGKDGNPINVPTWSEKGMEEQDKRYRQMLEKQAVADRALAQAEEKRRAMIAATAREQVQFEEDYLVALSASLAAEQDLINARLVASPEDRARMWQQVYKFIDDQQEQDYKDAQDTYGDVKEAVSDNIDIARQLGLTFSSAFEDAILGGKAFRDVLKGMSQDIARLMLRKSVTEPIAAEGSKLLGEINWGEIFGFGRAVGGSVPSGAGMRVMENGPEVFSAGGRSYLLNNGGVAGMVTPVSAAGSGAANGPVFNVDMRGASVEAVARLERLVAQVNGSIESRALGVMRGARVRGAA